MCLSKIHVILIQSNIHSIEPSSHDCTFDLGHLPRGEAKMLAVALNEPRRPPRVVDIDRVVPIGNDIDIDDTSCVTITATAGFTLCNARASSTSHFAACLAEL